VLRWLSTGFFWLWGWGLLLPLQAQVIDLNGRFLSDSIRVGEPIKYVLVAKYPLSKEIVFPDSSFSYAPFEWISKQYAPSQLSGNNIVDSVVYTLTTFELDSIQDLQIPVYLLDGLDSVEVFPPSASVIFSPTVTDIPDSALFKTSARYEPVETGFNYPVFIGIALGILALITAIYFLFGKSLIRKWRLYRLRISFEKFEKQFTSRLNENALINSPGFRERTLNYWKSWLTNLEKKPIRQMTTKEITKVYPEDNEVHQGLRSIDVSIYGKSSNEQQLQDNFQKLAEFARQRYLAQIEIIMAEKSKDGRKLV
jgi:hypothetical protein